MVNLVPSLLRKIVTPRSSTFESNAFRRSESVDSHDSPVSLSAGPNSPSVRSVCEGGYEEPCTPICSEHVVLKGNLFEEGVTSNIATIALGDWGYPIIGSAQGELKISGKYFKGLLRNCVNSIDPLEGFIAVSPASRIPKVEESDFAEYLRQVSTLYGTMEGESVLGEKSDPCGTAEDTSDSHVPKEYYSESYDIAKNRLFQQELDNIPTILSSLELQLKTVNGELQELLERRYTHVHEASISVEELHKRFLDVTTQINGIRIDLDGGSASSDGATGTHRAAISTFNKEELDGILLSGIERKRILQGMLSQLQLLRAIAAVPEHIQSIADSNGLAVANIVRDYMVHYLETELSSFRIAQTVASVLGETASTVVRVAETKFINLALVAIVEVCNSTDISEGIESLKAILNQLSQPLIALVHASSMEVALVTLAVTSKDSKAIFTYGEYDTWSDLMAAFERHGNKLITFLFLLHVWGCMLLRRVFCAERSPAHSRKIITAEEAVALIKKLLLIIQDRAASVSQHGNMATVSQISALISNSITLQSFCDDDMDYASIYDKGLEDDAASNQNNFSDDTEGDHTSSFANYVASVKGTMDGVAMKTFEDFVRHLVISCNIAIDFEVKEFAAFIEHLKAFSLRYEQLLKDIQARDLLFSMVRIGLSRELESHASVEGSTASVMLDTLNEDSNAEEDIHYRLRELADQAILSIGISCLEPLKLGNITKVQKALAEETWDEFHIHSSPLYDESFALVKSASAIDERLNLYSLLIDASPSCREDATQDCIQLVSLYHSLLDAEISVLQSSETDLDDAVMHKACLMAESLRYFSRRVVNVAGEASTSVDTVCHNIESSTELSSGDDGSSRQGYYTSVEKCSDDIESLKQRLLHILSTDIGNKMKRCMVMWVLQPTDSPYDDTGLQEMIQVVQKSVDVISVVLKDVTDVQMVFEIAFQQLHASIRRDAIEVERIDEFRDSCMEFITRLSHNICIKLEICWLADTISNELFS